MAFNNWLTKWVPPKVQPWGGNKQVKQGGGVMPPVSVPTPGQDVLAQTGTMPTAVNTTTPSSSNVIEPSQTQTAVTTPKIDPLWSNVPAGLQQSYEKNLSDALTGKMYDPFAAAQQEGEAHAEANRRASTASQIASAGFSGTGIGAAAGSATEDTLLKQRFDTATQIEQARNASKMAAMPVATDYAKMSTEATTAAKSQAGQDFSAYVENHPDLTAASIQSDPSLKSMLQNLWTQQGNSGTVDANWAAQQVNAVKQTSDAAVVANKSIDYEITQGIYTPEEGDIAKSLLNNKAFLGAYEKDPATGKYVLNLEKAEKALSLPAGTLTGAKSAETTTEDLVSDPLSTDADKVIAAGPSDPNYGKVVSARASDAIKNNRMDKLQELQKTAGNSAEYKKAIDSIPAMTDSNGGTLGSIVKLSDGTVAKVVGSARNDYVAASDIWGGEKYYYTLELQAMDGTSIDLENSPGGAEIYKNGTTTKTYLKQGTGEILPIGQ